MKNLLITVGIVLLATTTFDNVQAQSYGGSAHVHAEDDDGDTRVLITTWPCTRDTESDAKSALKSSLNNLTIPYEDFTSGIYYAIDRCDHNEGRWYGGTAFVSVKDQDDNKRVLNTDWPCTTDNVVDAKGALLSSLKRLKNRDEVFASSVEFDIDSCN